MRIALKLAILSASKSQRQLAARPHDPLAAMRQAVAEANRS